MRGLLLDAGGTLLHPAEPVAATYARLARAHGVTVDEDGVRARFRAAFAAPWPGLRYAGDGRSFWRRVVAAATGSADPDLFEALYARYAAPDAWTLAPGALAALDSARAGGLRVGVASNWDTRLRPLLDALGVLARVDAVTISAEVGVEKPDPAFYATAARRLGCAPAAVTHVGDDPALDTAAARAAGLRALTWGVDVASVAAAVDAAR